MMAWALTEIPLLPPPRTDAVVEVPVNKMDSLALILTVPPLPWFLSYGRQFALHPEQQV